MIGVLVVSGRVACFLFLLLGSFVDSRAVPPSFIAMRPFGWVVLIRLGSDLICGGRGEQCDEAESFEKLRMMHTALLKTPPERLRRGVVRGELAGLGRCAPPLNMTPYYDEVSFLFFFLL